MAGQPIEDEEFALSTLSKWRQYKPTIVAATRDLAVTDFGRLLIIEGNGININLPVSLPRSGALRVSKKVAADVCRITCAITPNPVINLETKEATNSDIRFDGAAGEPAQYVDLYYDLEDNQWFYTPVIQQGMFDGYPTSIGGHSAKYNQQAELQAARFRMPLGDGSGGFGGIGSLGGEWNFFFANEAATLGMRLSLGSLAELTKVISLSAHLLSLQKGSNADNLIVSTKNTPYANDEAAGAAGVPFGGIYLHATNEFRVRLPVDGGGGSDDDYLLPALYLATGNSLTNGAPNYIPLISITDGVSDQDAMGDLNEDQFAVEGRTLKAHFLDANWLNKVQSQAWTHFILQGLSTEAAGAGYADFISYGRQMASAIYSANPNARIILYATPAYNAANAVGGNPNIYPGTFASPEDMYEQVVSGYEDLRDAIIADNPTAYPAKVAYFTTLARGLGAGLLASHPSARAFQLQPDGLHYNHNGILLLGFFFYSLITGRDATPYAAAVAASLSLSPTLSVTDISTWAFRYAVFGRLPVLIMTHPSDQTVDSGDPASFSVGAIGTGALSYQWKKNGVNISGATASTYNISSADPADNGAAITCAVTNTEGTVISQAAVLTVASPGPSITPIFINFTRAPGAGNNILFPTHDAVNYWNNLNAISDTDLGVIGTTYALIDRTNVASGITAELLQKGTGCNAAGPLSQLGYPDYASQVSWIGDVANPIKLKLTGFNPGQAYKFEAGGWRNAGDVRTVNHAYAGGTSGTASYNAGTNLVALASYIAVADGGGEIELTFSVGAPNVPGFHYTGMLKISSP